MTSPRLVAADPQLRNRHLLALPDGIGADEVETLALSRFGTARWEEAEEEAPQTRGIMRPVTAAFGIRAVSPTTPTAPALRLARLSRLRGPYLVEAEDCVSLGLPPSTAVVYDLDCPRERGRPPYPGGDRDGLKRAFPDGMPVREEERVVQWLVAAARRLGGAVRIGGSGAILTPDIDAAIDLTLLANRWLEPEEALAVVQSVVSRARLSEAAPSSSWTGPMPGAGRAGDGVPAFLPEAGGRGLRAALERSGVSDEAERARLYAEAAAYDELMLAAPPTPESYGVLVDLAVDGTISVEASFETEVPPLMRALPWTANGVVAYRVHWEPLLVEELEAEKPSFEHRVARGRASPQVQAVTRALHAELGGEIADEADFLVDPADL
ncbi:hypothetical protein Cch01nite_42290 [Cellulomonas chitinilytica]|uniref:Uncharacterized protein n=1 Tax=Cellulomonas chitinilytica TaxID=398759 RepID=A0A919P753_9CELL|nr:hypothetical protein [Cellulomonas chitinilytica]GIG23505.1 hypothetical protein Cch01nite_42290 [Cellulomonas chitinilytica]